MRRHHKHLKYLNLYFRMCIPT
uniref:Uncharacterized protein n=1 Tax=Arundo donax TaxID=35708 RepID=A0A0A9CB17_ARUDO